MTACKLHDNDHAAMTRWAENLGESFALGIHAKGGSLGCAREAAIVAFTRGIDRKAAQMLAGDFSSPTDDFYADRKAGEVLGDG